MGHHDEPPPPKLTTGVIISQTTRKFIVTASSLQLLVKIVSFVINWAILRSLDPSAWTLASVHLSLLYTTALCLTREPLRRSLPPTKPTSITGLLLKTTLPLSTAIVAMTYLSWVLVGGHPARVCLLYALAAWIELLSEPLQIIAIASLRLSLCATIESLAAMTAGVIQLVLVKRLLGNNDDQSQCVAVYFGYGLIAQAVFTVSAHCLVEIFSKKTTNKHRVFRCALAMHRIGGSGGDPTTNTRTSVSLLDHNYQDSTNNNSNLLLRAFVLQSLSKHFLSEGRAFLMAFGGGAGAITLEQQARSESIARLWALVARLILAPVEHASYVMLSQSVRRPSRRSLIESSDKSIMIRRKFRSKSANNAVASCIRSTSSTQPTATRAGGVAKKASAPCGFDSLKRRVHFKSNIDIRIINESNQDIPKRNSLRDSRMSVVRRSHHQQAILEELALNTKLVILLTASAAVLSWSGASALLQFYFGYSPPWTVRLFRLYALYYVVIAINGMTECVLQATASVDELNDQRTQMSLNSLGSMGLSWAICRRSVAGSGEFVAQLLLMIDMVSMLLRIGCSWRHIVRWQKQSYGIEDEIPFLLRNAMPSRVTAWAMTMIWLESTALAWLMARQKLVYRLALIAFWGLVQAWVIITEESDCVSRFVPNWVSSLVSTAMGKVHDAVDSITRRADDDISNNEANDHHHHHHHHHNNNKSD